MISFVEGSLFEKSPTLVVIDVNGIGYELLISVATYDALPETGQRVRLLTYQHVREDSLLLFGFLDRKEKTMFTKLISVSGIGPKLGLGILSGCAIGDLTRYIVNEEIDHLKRLPGIGAKTAQRLSLELKDKLGDVVTDGVAAPESLSGSQSETRDQAVMALVSLGYSRSEAERNLSKILIKSPDLPLDELIKKSLKKA